jgi:hypothetical protein
VKSRRANPITTASQMFERRRMGLGELIDLYYDLDDLTHDVRDLYLRAIGIIDSRQCGLRSESEVPCSKESAEGGTPASLHPTRSLPGRNGIDRFRLGGLGLSVPSVLPPQQRRLAVCGAVSDGSFSRHA